ncbi:MAG: (E)-4-hydroxy-3-methylbut-2-enyl-diphosphate synthase [Chlamydiales bacterium]
MLYQKKRRRTREVMVGNQGVGGTNRIKIQSMTTTDTADVQATIEQIFSLVDVGCEIVRVTVQGKKEALACESIKNGLIQKGYTVPLVADIHFYPPAALLVADFVDKIRINPGNFVDKRASFKIMTYDESTYASEIKKIEEKFSPLVEKCKRLKKAIRIGTNHGSLSDRIMNRYGDTPIGMVESAFEFTRICRQLDFHDIIFSMKSSNTRVMIEAYRLLVQKLDELGWDYPIHLGVTEAGAGEDGRVKSAIGIGSLLLDGIGDTIRVSLTEGPCHEIDPCKRIIAFSHAKISLYSPEIRENSLLVKDKSHELTSFSPPSRLGRVKIPPPLHPNGSVILTVSEEEVEESRFYQEIGCTVQLGHPVKTLRSVDGLIVDFDHPKLKKVEEAGIAILRNPYIVEKNWEKILVDQPDVLFFSPTSDYLYHTRCFFDWLTLHHLNMPVILKFHYPCNQEDLVIQASAECGSLLCDHLGEGICLTGSASLHALRSLSFSILQGARMRHSKAEFISCPSCGRTLFDLEEVASRIRCHTQHLVGVKIAIMGCIVNGPGEMADADFGYVGSRPGKIDLYVGKECVKKNIDMSEADDRLIELIKEHGRWIEPSKTQTN